MAVLKLNAGSFVEASIVANQFNVKAAWEDQPGRVSEILEKAAGFVADILPDIKKGWTLVTGNVHSWDDAVLSPAIAKRKLSEFKAGQGLPDADIAVTSETVQHLSSICQVFKLKSEPEAARLAIDIFAELQNGLWRGNGFSMLKKGQDSKPVDGNKYRLKPVRIK
jgi:hypothetical protein